MLKKQFEIKSSNQNYNIFCDLYLPEKDNVEKIIIACHGFGGDKNSSAIFSLAKSLTNFKIAVLAFDFPAHGISNTDGHNFTIKNCVNDINDIEYYIEKEFNNIEIGFFATSFGAYTLLLKLNSSEKIYNSIVLRCPALDMKSVFENSLLKVSLKEFLKNGECKLGFERKIVITKEYYNELIKNNIFKIYDTENKICIIHGTEDDIAPIKDSIKFQKKFNDRVVLYKIKGADHRFKNKGELKQVIDIATNYILENQ